MPETQHNITMQMSGLALFIYSLLRFTGIFILPALIIVSAIVNDLSNNHFNLVGFGQIRRFPSREQPVDDFGRNA